MLSIYKRADSLMCMLVRLTGLGNVKRGLMCDVMLTVCTCADTKSGYGIL